MTREYESGAQVRYVTSPANDNVLARARPLTCTDIRCIIYEHAIELAAAIDNAATHAFSHADPVKVAAIILRRLPSVQRSIVWRGSWLTKEEVSALQPDGLLLMAAIEVINLTRPIRSDEEVISILMEEVAHYSSALSGGTIR